MPNLDELKAALLGLVGGGASESQRLLVRDAVESGQIALATGERAAAVGGDANGATIVTGNGNALLSFGVAEADAARTAFAHLFPSRPYQLPPDLPDFTGREREIAELCEALAGDGGQAAISAIGGMGGIGKTTLAVRVARRLAPRYPDGQLVIELRGTSDDPLPPAQAMTELIRSLAPAARVPDDPRDIERLYRGTLEGRRVLILLDNAADAAQARPLLPSPPCAAVVTSRRAIVLPGLRRISLDVMGEDESRGLLRGILADPRPDDAELDAIAGACGYFPLALRVAGTFLALHEDWTPAEYLEALVDQRQRLQRLRVLDDPELDVAAVLSLSALQLKRERLDLAERWAMLAVFPTSFDRAAAVAVWATSEQDTRDGLSALVERSMVAFDREHHRYRLHDLMRDIAQSSWGADEPRSDAESRRRHLEQAAARHADHFRTVLVAASHLYREGSEGAFIGLALFDLERRNIDAGYRSAVTRAGIGEAADRLIADYAAMGWPVLSFRLSPSEQIHWYMAAVDAFRRLRDEVGELQTLGALGDAYLAANQLKLAESC